MTSEQGALQPVSQITTPATSNRVPRSFALRTETAAHDAFIPAPPQINNGDEARYTDKCGTYTKVILKSVIALVAVTAYKNLKRALNSGNPADFEAISL